MAGQCDICGKTTVFGHNVSFSKRRTNRRFKPNVQKKLIVVNGVAKRRNICTRCQRTALKAGRV